MQTIQFSGTPAMGDTISTNIPVATAFPAGSILKAVGDGTFALATLTDTVYGVAGVETFTADDEFRQAVLTQGHVYSHVDSGTLVGIIKVQATQVVDASGATVAGFIHKIG